MGSISSHSNLNEIQEHSVPISLPLPSIDSTSNNTRTQSSPSNPLSIMDEKAAGHIFTRLITEEEDPSLSAPHRHYSILIEASVILEKTYKRKKLELRSVMKRSSKLYEPASDLEADHSIGDKSLRLKEVAFRRFDEQLRDIKIGSFSDDATSVCECKLFLKDCITQLTLQNPRPSK